MTWRVSIMQNTRAVGSHLRALVTHSISLKRLAFKLLWRCFFDSTHYYCFMASTPILIPLMKVKSLWDSEITSSGFFFCCQRLYNLYITSWLNANFGGQLFVHLVCCIDIKKKKKTIRSTHLVTTTILPETDGIVQRYI